MLAGKALSSEELDGFALNGIEADIIQRACWRRVNSEEGCHLIGRNHSADYSGLAIPYIWPGETHVREYRLRRDTPDMEHRPDGTRKIVNKYLSPPGRASFLYFPPDIALDHLAISDMPIFIGEGEKKALALHGLALSGHEKEPSRYRWITIGIAGVWGWRGVVGREPGPDGKPLRVKGPLPDFDRINWRNREVTIIFDSNVNKIEQVRNAREGLARELARRGARVRLLDAPNIEGVNGIDDLSGLWGKARTLEWLLSNGYDYRRREELATGRRRVNIDEIPSVHTLASKEIPFVVEGLIAEGAIHLFTGESGHGKSTFATALAASIATGGDFAGRACRKRKVLILDRENSIGVVAERLNRLRISDGDYLKIWGGWITNDAPDPASEDISSWVSRLNPKPVIAADSLIAFLECDENSSNEVRRFMTRMRRLANLGVTIILLHHVGKGESSSEYRGSSDIKAAVDIGICIENDGGSELGTLQLRAFKTRFPISRDLTLKYVDGEFKADSPAKKAFSSTKDALWELLRNNPGIKKAEFGELASTAGLPRDQARRFLEAGVVNKTVRMVPGKKGALQHFLVEEDRDGILLAKTSAF